MDLINKYKMYIIAIAFLVSAIVLILVLKKKGKLSSIMPNINNNQTPIKPLASWFVTSPFGKRGSSFHNGIDLRANIGTPIYAPIDGTVAHSTSDAGGKQLILTAGNTRLGFAHLSGYNVSNGATVKQGDIIAYTGNTGSHTSGPHLHYTYTVGGEKQDPETFHA